MYVCKDEACLNKPSSIGEVLKNKPVGQTLATSSPPANYKVWICYNSLTRRFSLLLLVSLLIKRPQRAPETNEHAQGAVGRDLQLIGRGIYPGLMAQAAPRAGPHKKEAPPIQSSVVWRFNLQLQAARVPSQAWARRPDGAVPCTTQGVMTP